MLIDENPFSKTDPILDVNVDNQTLAITTDTVHVKDLGIDTAQLAADSVTSAKIADGAVIPEFGTIAIMILVVAIVSIIALSAKTKLSLVPRY